MEKGTTRTGLARRAGAVRAAGAAGVTAATAATAAAAGAVTGAAAGSAAGGAAAVIAHAAPGITAIGPLRRKCFPALAGFGAPGHIALTFDDGPDSRSTPRFLDLLAARGTHATFFLLGSMVARAPGLAAEITAAGHEVGVHGWDHRYLPLRGPRAVHDDIARARDAVAAATGAVPAFYRPPHGVLSSAALATAGRLGLTPLLWTCWGREWVAGATAESVLATIRRDLTAGATVLLHDSDCTSPPGSCRSALGALPALLDECAGRGWRVGTAAEHGCGAGVTA
ncbi:MAG TPA: polysaccharide deacetylase family protein [Streptosporangiaceae bacterium]|nr:polysaccharide deacetylase family protein [Streptosporangiaceae bacterium]